MWRAVGKWQPFILSKMSRTGPESDWCWRFWPNSEPLRQSPPIMIYILACIAQKHFSQNAPWSAVADSSIRCSKTFYALNFVKETWRIICIFPFLDTEMVLLLEILPHGRQGPFILLCQYHGSWCPGDARSQVISHHDIDPVLKEYFRLSTTKFNIMM